MGRHECKIRIVTLQREPMLVLLILSLSKNIALTHSCAHFYLFVDSEFMCNFGYTKIIIMYTAFCEFASLKRPLANLQIVFIVVVSL